MALTIVEPLLYHRDLRRKTKNDAKPLPDIVTTPATAQKPPYYFEDGLRKVKPYHYTYNTYCKERWRGREILDIFSSEFRDRPQEYYVK